MGVSVNMGVSVCLHVSQHGCVVNAYVYGSTVYAPCIGVTCVGKGVYPLLCYNPALVSEQRGCSAANHSMEDCNNDADRCVCMHGTRRRCCSITETRGTTT